VCFAHEPPPPDIYPTARPNRPSAPTSEQRVAGAAGYRESEKPRTEHTLPGRTTMQDHEVMKALASYTGPITRCPPGYARGKRVKSVVPVREGPAMAARVDAGHERRALRCDETARWLSEHAKAIVEQRWAEREKERRGRERHLRRRQARARARMMFNAAEAWFWPLSVSYSTMGTAFSARGNTYFQLSWR
jgi:hypothetical protein